MATGEHQSLSKYSGSLYGRPTYEGIEYDWEVPDDKVIGSPGGVSSVHHHYTKGFNGRGNTSSDVYAGQGERYNSGVYGSLYQTGQEAGQAMGMYPAAPDYQFWQNEEPSQYSYTHGQAATWAPSMKIYSQPGAYEGPPGKNQKKGPVTQHPGGVEKYVSGGLYVEDSPEIEGYETMAEIDDGPEGGNFELIEPADIEEQYTPQEMAVEKDKLLVIPVLSPWMMFLFFILAFVAFDFWAEAGHLFIRQKMHAGGAPTWKQAVLYAMVVTIIFIFIIWMAGIPISNFESV